jgi:hypothetical protein
VSPLPGHRVHATRPEHPLDRHVFVIVGFFILIPLSLCTFVDEILMLSGNVRDKAGRNLR